MGSEQAAGAVDGAGDARGDGLVDGDGAGGVVMRRGLVPVAGLFALPLPFPVALSLSLAFTFSLSFLVATGHLLVLLDGAVSLVHVAVSIVRGAAAADALAVHCDLADNSVSDMRLEKVAPR